MPDIFVSKSKKKEEKEQNIDFSPTSFKKVNEDDIKEKTIKPTPVKKLNKQPFEEVRKEEATKDHGLPMYQKSPLAAFLFYPDGIEFENREAEEKVILFLRQHPIVNVPWILLALIMFFAPTFVSGLSLFSEIPSNFKFIFILIWYLITTVYILEKFLTWFFNVYIITDERIVDVDFYNLIYKEVSDAKIDKIEDMTFNMGGVIRTIFNFGNVLIQTAAEVPNFEFIAVPKPDKVVRILQDLQIEEEQEAIEGRVH